MLWIVLAFLFVAVMALVRIAFLGGSDRAVAATSLEDALLPDRGEIVDRNGVPLARAFPPTLCGSIRARAKTVRRSCASGTPRRIEGDLPRSERGKGGRTARSGKAGYLRAVRPKANRCRISTVALEMPQENDRHYPQGSMAATFSAMSRRMGMGAWEWNRCSTSSGRSGEPGHSGCAVDRHAGQGALEDELRRGMKLVQAQGGAGIVLDVDTGEVLALASLPEFDPNKIDARGQKLMFNRVTNQVYELGSTFKPLSVAAAIDAGVVRNLGRRWDASPVKVERFAIKDSHYLGGSLNVPSTLIHSSNTVARIADKLGPEKPRRT